MPFCAVDAVVALRRGAARPELRPASPAPVAEGLLGAIGSFGERVRRRHASAIDELTARGAWQLEYDTPEEAVALLNGFAERRRA